MHALRPRAARPPRAVVFDLDDTLYDAFGQCVRPAQREAALAMQRAGLRAPLEAILALREGYAGGRLDVDLLVAQAFPCADVERVALAGRRAFFERDPGPITPHPFTREVLEVVGRRSRAVLLTAGAVATQRTKVARLGLSDLLDPLIFVDPARGEDKETALAAFLTAAALAAPEVLVVGDRPEAEIRAALRLGCPALRIRAGECVRTPTPPGAAEAPDVRAVLTFL